MTKETEMTRVYREAAEADKRYRTRHGEVQALAREAARKAERAVFDEHESELDELLKDRRAAIIARDQFVETNASHPLEGRLVERTYDRARYSWQGTKMVTERGRLEIHRPSTRFPDSLKNYDTPDLGALFIRTLKKDGSEGSRVIKVYHVDDDGSISCGGMSYGRGWHLVPEGEASEGN